MVRTSQATTLTFSSSPYFYDRGHHGTAQPITERINVRPVFEFYHAQIFSTLSQPHSRPIVSYYFPKGVGAQHYGVYNF